MGFKDLIALPRLFHMKEDQMDKSKTKILIIKIKKCETEIYIFSKLIFLGPLLVVLNPRLGASATDNTPEVNIDLSHNDMTDTNLSHVYRNMDIPKTVIQIT